MAGVAPGGGPHQRHGQGGAAEGRASREVAAAGPPGLAAEDGLGSVGVLGLARCRGPRVHRPWVRGLAHPHAAEAVSGSAACGEVRRAANEGLKKAGCRPTDPTRATTRPSYLRKLTRNAEKLRAQSTPKSLRSRLEFAGKIAEIQRNRLHSLQNITEIQRNPLEFSGIHGNPPELTGIRCLAHIS